VLLHATPDLIDHLGAEPHHVERVEHGDGIWEAVMNRVGVATERVQWGVVDAVDEALGLVVQPGLVVRSGAARNRIQQSGMQASGLVTGQINDDGDGPIDPDPRRPPVGSGCGALSRLPVVGFHSPPAEPGVRFSPHRALHVLLPLVSR